jgi:N-acetylneuraminic acid mutarotase
MKKHMNRILNRSQEIALAVLAFSLSVTGIAEAGTFIPTSLPHAHHTGTEILLPNGDVLLFGAVSKTNLPPAELYDPATGTWRATAAYPWPSNGRFTATVMRNGKLLVAGGLIITDGASQSSAEIYDPEGETWRSTSDMNVARDNPTAVSLSDGRVLMAGGAVWIWYELRDFAIPNVEIYDPTTGKWTETTHMTIERAHAFGTLLSNGEVLVIGGDGDDTVGHYALTTAEIYNPDTRFWRPAGKRPSDIGGFSCVQLMDERILVTGGYTNSIENGRPVYVRDVDIYDPKTQIWKPTGPLNVAGAAAGTLLPSGKVLRFSIKPELYDPATESWTVLTNWPSGTIFPLQNGNFLVTQITQISSSGVPRGQAHFYLDITAISLAPLRRGDGTFELTFTNTPNQTFTILSSNDLNLPLHQWTSFGPAAENSPGQFKFADQTATNAGYRFYAVRSP